MIIYGYRNKEIEQGTGSFYCLKCEAQQPYKYKKVVRQFTLFFIPLFPLGTLNVYVECSVCGRTYKPEILSAASTTNDGFPSQPKAISDYQNIQQTVSKPKGNYCLSWALILGGVFLLIFAGLMGIAMVAVQFDNAAASGMASFILAVIICPAPLSLMGLIAMGGGIYLLRTRNEIDTL